MKKTIITIVCIILVIAIAGVFVGCNLNDEFAKLQRAVSGSIESANSLDKAAAQDLDSNNMISAATEFETIVMLSADSGLSEGGALTVGQKVIAVMDYLDGIKAKQTLLDADAAAVKLAFADFKDKVKSFRSSGLTLSAEDKAIVAAYIDETLALKQSITATIGKVYAAIRTARQSYSLATIDEALAVLTDADAQMTIRVNSVARVNEILSEVNAMLDAKLNPELEEQGE
ncbi:MAG: hypothetical protein EOM87_00355 [Clostridia bacterium]|nr:hypothetical protein [Clostridia bacterium]